VPVCMGRHPLQEVLPAGLILQAAGQVGGGGTKRALIVVARKLLAMVWHVLTTGETYDETRYEQTKKNEEERRKQKFKAEAAKLGFKLMPV